MINLCNLAGVGILTPFPASRRLMIVGVALLLAGVTVNELLVARYLSADGVLSTSTVFNIRIMQAVLITAGLSIVWRRRAVLAVLLLCLAALNVFALQATVRSVDADPRVVVEQRLRVLRDLLPTEGYVGFVSDAQPLSAAEGDSRERYYITQFAVVPVVVEASSSRTVVIVNARETQSIAGFEVVHDLGDGLVLLRKRSE